jgi:hypothetical protein
MIPDWVQWPAMIVTVISSWLVASRHKRHRAWGFWTFLLSNVLWVAWGVPNNAWALVALQVALAGMNIRGVRKTEEKQTA